MISLLSQLIVRQSRLELLVIKDSRMKKISFKAQMGAQKFYSWKQGWLKQ